MAIARPLIGPYLRMAWAAYSEQVGSYRHTLGLYLDTL